MKASLNLLLIEDDENDVFFFKRALKRLGISYPLVVLTDGQSALDYLGSSGAFLNKSCVIPHVIFLDLKLPYRGGLEVLQWARYRPEFRETLIIVLTSSSMEKDIREAYRLGADSFLTKPGDPAELLGMLRKVKGYLDGENLLPQIGLPPSFTPAPRFD